MGKPKGKAPTRLDKRALKMPTRGPSKLTQAVEDEIATHVEAGSYIETACEAAGIAQQTYYDWLRWGAEGREPYASFRARMLQARATAEARDVAFIAASGDWRARSWRLEKMHGRKYAGVTVTESRIDVDIQSPEQLTAKVRAIYGIAPPAPTQALVADVTGNEVETVSGGEEQQGEGASPGDGPSGDE